MNPLDALRRAVMLRAMAMASARRSIVSVSGLRLVVERGVCNPAPALGLSFSTLFDAGVEGLCPGARVLDVGTGSGVWALLAVRAGAEVTATDLAHVPFDSLRASARLNGLASPRHLHGDLFEPVVTERFERVLFNPPFHLGEPASDNDRAYLGGDGGEVLRRFFDALPGHLSPGGRGFVILPRIEHADYEDALRPFTVQIPSHIWLPVLGRVELLELST